MSDIEEGGIRPKHRRSARATLIAALVVPTVLLLATPPAAADTAEDVATATEAWYRTPLVGGGEDPACSSPAGCPFQPAAPADPYPEDTLHVGAATGRQESATFVTFARVGIPFDAELTGGAAVLPVASQESGTFQPESAKIVACLVTEPFEPVQGGPPEKVPEVDCTTKSEAVFQPDADPVHFTVDLAPFVSRWSSGTPDNGIGLLVGEQTQGTWHVAFSASGREGEGVAPPITASFDFTTPPDDVPAPSGAGTSDTTGADSFNPPASSQSDDSSAPSFAPERSSRFVSAPEPEVAPSPGRDAAEPPPVAAPPVAAPAARAAVTGGYAYPATWLLPLVLMSGAGLLARSLSNDVEVLADDAPRGLLGRLWLAFFPDSGRIVRA